MSSLVAVVFDDEITAFDMRTALMRMQKENLIELEDSVVVTRNSKGKVKLDQAVNLTAAGAIGGGFWGMLIGLLFLNPLLGAAVGGLGLLQQMGTKSTEQKQLDQLQTAETGAAIWYLPEASVCPEASATSPPIFLSTIATASTPTPALSGAVTWPETVQLLVATAAKDGKARKGAPQPGAARAKAPVPAPK